MSRNQEDIRSLFTDALAIESKFERAAFLDQRCDGDAAMRQEIESLLAAHSQAGGFLDAGEMSPTETTDASATPTDGREGTRFGPYKLLRKIGEGGMGVVYMAAQSEPVRRRVAVKFIKPGSAGPRVIARFEAERQALAMMNHPNIATILDAGTTDEGVPYFVMELVKGKPITEYCDEHKLSIHERLALLITVAEAVQHAHQKGIIHRDLKPSNILIAEYDHHPVPKVIDFGVAKALSQELTDRDLFTSFEQVIGTLEYMSPEQAKFNQLDVDTRSDVYSLGVVLYELLTGATPLEELRARRLALDELLRTIREVEPPVPSARLSSSGSLPAIAANRSLEPRGLTTQIRGDLDWIAMRALEKDRSRRYESAMTFRGDLERFRNHQPVAARPPSLTYRTGKFIRRHRTGVVATAVVLLALGIGAVQTVVKTIEANRAYQREREANDRLERQIDVAEEHARIATLNRQHAENAVWEFFIVVSESPELQNLPGSREIRRTLIGNARNYFTGALKDAETWDLYAQATAWNRLANLENDLGNLEEALSAVETSLGHWTELLLAEPDNAEYRSAVVSSKVFVAKIHSVMGDQQTAFRLAKEVQPEIERLAGGTPRDVEILKTKAWLHNMLGMIHMRLDEVDEALAEHDEGIHVCESILAEVPEEADVISRLAGCYHNSAVLFFRQRRLGEATEFSAKAFEITKELLELRASEDEVSLLSAVQTVRAQILFQQGRVEEALSFHQKSLANLKNLELAAPDLPEHQEGLGKVYNSIGVILDQQGDSDGARQHFEQAIAVHESLHERFPDHPEYARELIKNYGNLIGEQLESRETNAAMALAETCVRLAQRLRERFPTNPEHVMLDGSSRSSRGDAFRAAGQTEAAKQAYEDGCRILAGLAQAEPDVAMYQSEYALALADQAAFYLHQGDPRNASESYKRAVEVLKPLALRDVPDARCEQNFTYNCVRIGDLAAAQSNHAEAIEYYDLAIQAGMQLYENENRIPRNRVLVLGALCNQALVFGKQGEREKELENLIRAVRLGEDLVAANQTSGRLEQFLTNCRLNLAQAYLEVGRADEAIEVYETIAKMTPPKSQLLRSYQIMASRTIAQHLARNGEKQAAESRFDESADLARRFAVGEDVSADILREAMEIYRQQAKFFSEAQRSTETRRAHRTAIELAERLIAVSDHDYDLNTVADLYGEAAASADVQTAVEYRARAVALGERLRDENPDSLYYASKLTALYTGMVTQLDAKPRESLVYIEKTIALLEDLISQRPSEISYRESLVKTYINRAINLAENGRIEAAIESYDKALAVDGTAAGDGIGEDLLANWRIPALINSAMRLETQDRETEAAERFRAALSIGEKRVGGGDRSIRLHIETSFARIHVARMLLREGSPEDTVELLAAARERLAEAINEKTQVAYANGFLSRALAVERDCFTALVGTDRAQLQLRQTLDDLNKSINWCERELPRWPAGHPNYQMYGKHIIYLRNARGWQLATDPREEIRDGTQAVIDASRACELNGHQNWAYLDTLAAAMAETGDFEKAVDVQRQANELAPEQYIGELQSHLACYLAGEPFHQERAAKPGPPLDAAGETDDASPTEEAEVEDGLQEEEMQRDTISTP